MTENDTTESHPAEHQTPVLSVVIPVLNGEARLSETLRAVSANGRTCEVMIVAAGTTEETAALARRNLATVLISPLSQRAAQMNLGAANSAGDILLFLHADTVLPENALEAIEAVLKPPSIIGGAFARRYEPSTPFLNATCFLAELRSRMFGWFLGDQAMFVRRTVFERLGGFRDYEAFEDLDFARRMQREGRVVTLRPPVISSARRFHVDGAFRKTLSDFWLTLRYLSGVHPNQLALHHKERGMLSTLEVDSQREELG